MQIHNRKIADATKKIMKEKLSEILLYVVIGEMLVVAVSGGLCVEAWRGLKRLLAKKKAIETAEEKLPEFEFHCHECGEHFMVGGLVLGDGLESKILTLSKKCPNCGSTLYYNKKNRRGHKDSYCYECGTCIERN